MSGPKTSHLNLTPEQREALRQQRLARAELAVLKKQLEDLRAVVLLSDTVLGKLEPVWMEDGEGNALQQAKILRNDTMESLNQAASMTDTVGPGPIAEMNRNIRRMMSHLGQVTRKLEGEYETTLETFRTASGEQIVKGFGLNFGELTPKKPENPLRGRILAELESLSCLELSAGQRQSLAALRDRAENIQDEAFLKNYHAVTVAPFVKECLRYHESYSRDGAEYERKKLLLEENCRQLDMPCQDIPFGPNALAELDALLRQTEEAIAFREEQAYISRCLDEAMKEMGYDLLGSRDITRRSGKKFHNELYLFEEGTAVNVTYSGDGQISMELGGICREDRLPTGEESAALTEDMESFCDDYAQLEKILRKKGISTRRISVLPPDARYAQMINVSDYDLQSQPEEFRLKQDRREDTHQKKREAGETD